MFLVLGIPRSRTFWLSKFLSYGDFDCGHEEARYLRSMDDIKTWLAQENHGSCETAVAPFWRLAPPNLPIVVVRRPVEECVENLMALDMTGVCEFDRAKVTAAFAKIDSKLSQIERRMQNVLSVRFDDLNNEKTIRAVWAHCLPYEFDRSWWEYAAPQQMLCNMRALMRYSLANRTALDKMAKIAGQQIRAAIMAKPVASNGVVIAQEPFDAWERDGAALFRQHCADVGEAPDNWANKNIPLMRKLYDAGALHITTARCNGRMFGYLAAVVSPSLETRGQLRGVHTTFFVSKEMPGLGLKLQRASVAALKAKGASEVWFVEGERGSGPRLGVLYRRIGAEEFGKLYRLRS